MSDYPFRRFCRSFKYAARGLHLCLHERNFRFHTVAAGYVLLMARHFLTTPAQWCVLILTIALVLCAEGVNTAIEQVVDLVCPERDARAARAKDIAAGAVLVCAIAAAAVACVLFLRWEPWRALLLLWQRQWWRPLLLFGSLAGALYLVFRK